MVDASSARLRDEALSGIGHDGYEIAAWDVGLRYDVVGDEHRKRRW